MNNQRVIDQYSIELYAGTLLDPLLLLIIEDTGVESAVSFRGDTHCHCVSCSGMYDKKQKLLRFL